MKAPLSWLRSYVDLPDAKTVADRLAALGFPVEHIHIPPTITGVVFGRITALTPHPNADRLQVCTLDIGAETSLTIATAATNVAVDQVVPVAQIGAQLPELQIAPRKMRGIDSEGMLCSAAELGLPAAWFEDGILQCDRTLPLGTDVVAALGLADPVLDIEVTTNRPDALSLLGIARELGAAFSRPVRLPDIADLEKLTRATELTIKLESPDVQAFFALDVGNISHQSAPILMRTRLAQAGVRPIDALVDITNYVMLEYGRPLHFFDAEAIEEQTIIVRDANPQENLTTLDEIERKLDPVHLVVADAKKPLALAGVFGGRTSGIRAATSRAILEAAHFRGARIRRSAAAAGLRTEASARFEKGLPIGMLEPSIARAVALLQAVGADVARPAQAGSIADTTPAITFMPNAVERILGVTLDTMTITGYLTRLGCTVREDGTALTVTPPPWRGDLIIGADLVEEIARVHGYDKLETAVARVQPPTVSSDPYLQERALAHAMQTAGYSEIVTLSLEPAAVRERFSAADAAPARASLEIRNPLSEEQRFLRFSLLPALLEILARRRFELRDRELHLFEIGSIFGAGTPPLETRQVIWCSARRAATQPAQSSWRDEYFFDAKGRTERMLRTLLDAAPQSQAGSCAGLHPGKSAVFIRQTQPLAFVGVVDPRLLAAYDLDADVVAGCMNLADLPPATVPQYITPSRYPGMSRDLAFVMERSVPAARVLEIMRAAEPLASELRVFDEYHGPTLGENMKSLTLRFVLQRQDATLTDEDAEASVQRMIAALRAEIGAELRR